MAVEMALVWKLCLSDNVALPVNKIISICSHIILKVQLKFTQDFFIDLHENSIFPFDIPLYFIMFHLTYFYFIY